METAQQQINAVCVMPITSLRYISIQNYNGRAADCQYENRSTRETAASAFYTDS